MCHTTCHIMLSYKSSGGSDCVHGYGICTCHTCWSPAFQVVAGRLLTDKKYWINSFFDLFMCGTLPHLLNSLYLYLWVFSSCSPRSVFTLARKVSQQLAGGLASGQVFQDSSFNMCYLKMHLFKCIIIMYKLPWYCRWNTYFYKILFDVEFSGSIAEEVF